MERHKKPWVSVSLVSLVHLFPNFLQFVHSLTSLATPLLPHLTRPGSTVNDLLTILEKSDGVNVFASQIFDKKIISLIQELQTNFLLVNRLFICGPPKIEVLHRLPHRRSLYANQWVLSCKVFELLCEL